MTFEEFLSSRKPGYHCEQVRNRTDGIAFGSLHYLYTLEYKGREFSGFYSCGAKAHVERRKVRQGHMLTWEEKTILPPVQSVLECLQSDCQTGDNTYLEFCGEYGYNAGLSEGHKTWMACRETRDSLIDLFGRAVFNEFMGVEFE